MSITGIHSQTYQRSVIDSKVKKHCFYFENNDYFCQSIIGTILHSTNLHLRHVQLRTPLLVNCCWHWPGTSSMIETWQNWMHSMESVATVLTNLLLVSILCNPSSIVRTFQLRTTKRQLPKGLSCEQCCGYWMFIPDPDFFDPGSRIQQNKRGLKKF